MLEVKKFVLDLGWPMARLNKFTSDKHTTTDELLIICPHDSTENFPYIPAMNISIVGQDILKLRDFLNEHYPKV